jgi:hypothetical protein
MSRDRNEFFRQAARQICGSLDIERAMANCFRYVQAFLPMNEMILYFLDPDLNVVRVIASVTSEEVLTESKSITSSVTPGPSSGGRLD